MENRYRQMLIDQKTHETIDSAKRLISRISGQKLSSRDVINEFVGRKLRFLEIDHDIRAYINAFASEAVLDRAVAGLMLFGSVAKGSFGKLSDIDMLVVVEGSAMGSFDSIERAINNVERLRKPFVSKGFNLRIRPLILSTEELARFRPIYIDFLEDGIVLFERNEVIFNFLNDIRKNVKYERSIRGNSVVVTWKIRG
jgi:predicted nucleotidyltransferase